MEPGLRYMAIVEWRPSPRVSCKLTVCSSKDEATATKAVKMLAEEQGYQPPRFWQWWRWGEPKDGLYLVNDHFYKINDANPKWAADHT